MTYIGEEAEPNVRCSRYIIVESRIVCPQCEKVTAVFALALPAGYESIIVDDDGPGNQGATWEASGMAAVLSYVEYLPEAVINRIQAVTSHYRFDLQKESGVGLWRNHCEHCGAKVEEEELHGDLDSPFGPMPARGLEAIQLHQLREPFEAWVGSESHDVKVLDS